MVGWQKLLLAAGGAAGAAAVIYCLIRDDHEQRLQPREAVAAADGDGKKKFTKEQALKILREVADSQESIREHMKALTKGLIDSGSAIDFDSIYDQIHAVQPEDPLERHGLSVPDFDQLLNQYQGDPEVREGMARIMGMADAAAASAADGKAVDDAKLIQVHTFMIEELERLVSHFSSIKGSRDYDLKTVTLAVQAAVSTEVERKFGLASEDIERAVFQNHTKLATNQEFANINARMQQKMAELMGPLAP